MKNKFLKEYFNFSRKELNGIIILALLLIIVLGLRILANNYQKSEKTDFSEFENEIDSFIKYNTFNFSEFELFRFDPNTASPEDLLKLGFSPRSVNEIIAYRNSGKKFYKTEDLLRIKSIKKEDFEKIKDFVIIKKDFKKYSNNNRKNYSNKNTNIKLFYFDPNTATKETLLELGFKDWQAQNIIKYRDKGGKFRKPEDLFKIYGLDQSFVKNLIEYVIINDTSETANNTGENVSVEINSADEEQLQSITGIGPVYAKRIIKYRNLLGGYYEIEQLHEVYGMNDEIFKILEQNIIIDKSKIKTININDADFKTLISHPYIDEANTKAILNYRKFAGKINSFEELVQQKAITKNFYTKVSPYISVK